jgi:hypothetical protein
MLSGTKSRSAGVVRATRVTGGSPRGREMGRQLAQLRIKSWGWSSDLGGKDPTFEVPPGTNP